MTRKLDLMFSPDARIYIQGHREIEGFSRVELANGKKIDCDSMNDLEAIEVAQLLYQYDRETLSRQEGLLH